MARDMAGGNAALDPRRPRHRRDLNTGQPASDPALATVPAAGSRTFRALLLRSLSRAASLLELHAWFTIIVFALVLYLPLSTWEAHNAPLTHDEIFTVHIAQAPDLASMLALRREIDLHPPLHYLIQREALHLPAPRWLSSRLPSIVAGALALLGLFGFTARRLGVLAGFVAAAIFWFGPLPEFAWENRPYMLWYALLALLMLAWARAADHSSPLRLALVTLLAFLLALTHLFGLACLLPFVIAEAIRGRRLGRTQWPLLISLAAPLPLAALALFQLQHLGANGFPSSSLPDLSLAGSMYFHTITDLFYVFGGCAVALGLLTRGHSASEGVQRGRAPLSFVQRHSGGLPPEELVMLVGLVALPLPLMVAGSFAHIQFWGRYGFFVVLPMAVLGALLVQRLFEHHARVFAVLTTCALFAGAIARFFADVPQSPFATAAQKQPGLAPLRLQQLDAALPIVAASPMTFVEMSDREPAGIAARTFYLTDREMALQFSGYTLFENEEKIRGLLHLPSRTAPLDEFIGAHTRFYLLATFASTHPSLPQQWLPRALLARGYSMRYLGKIAATYDEDDLYLVDTSAAPPLGPVALRPSPTH